MKQLYKEGVEEYSKGKAIGQNLFMLAYFIVAFAGMYALQIYGFPIVSVIYILFVVAMLLFVLRKHLCTNCYYYDKWCNNGWGKLSSLFFKKASGNYELGGKLAGPTWMLITIVPVIGMIAALALNWFSALTLALLVVFLVLTGINFQVHKKACEKCKMRLSCPGSTAK